MRVGYTGIPNTRIHLGAIQPIMTMYDATSSAELTTMERPAVVTTLVGAFGGDNARKGIEATWQKENVFYNGSNLMFSVAYTGERAGSTNGSDPRRWSYGHAPVERWREQCAGRCNCSSDPECRQPYHPAA
jgi:phosphate-selective porin